MSVRTPAVAGQFYSDDASSLAADLAGFLADVDAKGPPPKALILPHAGYMYSGPVAVPSVQCEQIASEEACSADGFTSTADNDTVC